MEETTKVFLIVGLAVLMSFLGYIVKGAFGSIMAFIITLLVAGLFIIWKKNAES